MSILIDTQCMEDAVLEVMTRELTVVPKKTFEGGDGSPVYVFRTEGTQAYVPFDYGNKIVNAYPNDEKKYTSMKQGLKFVVPLRQTQVPVVKEALERLNTRRCVFLALHTGFGKTITAIHLSWRAQLQTLIIYHRDILVEQWIGSIRRCIPDAKIQVLETKDKIDPRADYVLCSVIKAGGRDDLYGFGTVILDECHALCSENYSKSILRTTPKFLIGLSASPDERSDGMGKIIDLHFGEYRIVKPLKSKFTLYRFNTGLDIPSTKNARGRTDWNVVLNNQAEHKERNEMITRIISHFKDRVILVLCKRIKQTEILYKMLKALGDDVEILVGNKKKYNYKCRVLLTTYSKSGVGFDNPRLDMLIIAGSVKEMFVQYLGRVFRGEDSNPIVVDVVDHSPSTLLSHWNERRAYYVQVGCERVNKLDETSLKVCNIPSVTHEESKEAVIILED